MIWEHNEKRVFSFLTKIQNKLYMANNQSEILKVLGNAGYKIIYLKIPSERTENSSPLFSEEELKKLKTFI